jgi:hypothetical protein
MKKVKISIDDLFRLESLIVLYFLTLLFFGRIFTKFQVAGPLYLHDAVLLALVIVAINRGKVTLRFKSILLLLCIAVAYLILSLLLFHLHGQMITMAFRQFNLFVYMGCTWILFNTCVKSGNDLYKPLYLIKLISELSVWLQVALILYGFLFIRGFSLFGEGDYNYFSPLAVFGIITYSAMALAYEKNFWWKYARFFLVLFLATTLGHSSAFLAVFMVLLIYFFTRITPLQRFVALGIVAGAVLLLKALPEFRDVNASWRLFYWQHIMHNVVSQHYLVLGNGFGKPYMTYDYAVYLNEVLHSPNMMDEFYPMARYLVPPHNSILTIFFHVGLLPGLLFFVPLRGYSRQLLLRTRSSLPADNFLLYALAGCFVWICFNVILELPHSATFFWLVFFAAAYAFKERIAAKKEINS